MFLTLAAAGAAHDSHFSIGDIVGCAVLVVVLVLVGVRVSRTRTRLRGEWERDNGRPFPVERGWRNWFGRNRGV